MTADRLAVQRVVLVVAQDLEEQRLIRDVVDKGARDRHAEVLYVEEAERRALAAVLDGLRREGLVVSMHEVELAEDVRVVGGDARDLQDYDPELECRAELEVARQFSLFHAAQPAPQHLARQVRHARRRLH